MTFSDQLKLAAKEIPVGPLNLGDLIGCVCDIVRKRAEAARQEFEKDQIVLTE